MLNVDVKIPRYIHRPRREEEHLRYSSTTVAFDSMASFVQVNEKGGGFGSAGKDETGDHDTHQVVDPARERVQDFENRLNARPDDVTIWIAYSRAHITNEQGDNRLAHLEISLSILDRALEIVPFTESASLHLEYLRVAAEVWPSARVEHAWSKLFDRVEQNVRSLSTSLGIFELWLGHLDWSEGRGFGRDGRDVDYVVELYEERLAMVPAYGQFSALVNQRGIGTNMLELEQREREERQLYLFHRVCAFLVKAGYQERATAAYQALMDL